MVEGPDPMSDELLFAFLRRLVNRGLSQAEVDETNAVLNAMREPIVITGSTVPHFQTIAAHLEREEGRVDHAYQDNLGYWTIGVGRLIDKRRGGKLSDDEIDTLLAHDICAKIDAIKDWPAWQAVKDDPVRATALLSMAFQLGVEGLAGFKNSLQLIADRQWHQAASNLMASLWARQTPNRARRVTQMIATGVMQQ
jgi:lysozyme